jgi:peptidyl-prolyl cis-trans isomerase B (cyclophilin B)
MDVVETIVSVPTDSLDAPLVPIPLKVDVVEMTAAQLKALGYTPAQ